VITLDGVTKRFGRRPALDGVSFTVEEGEVVGLVGPLGAGKSTTMRVLATLLLPDRGRATVAGHPVATRPREVRRAIGYLPDRPGTYARQTTREFLELCAGLHRVLAHHRARLAEELLEVVGLAERADHETTAITASERRRLALAGCLVHDPAVLLLDEPLTGLDQPSQDEVLALVAELGGLGKTVLLTARDADAVEAVCTSTLHLGDLGGHHTGAARSRWPGGDAPPTGDEPAQTVPAP